MASNTEPVELVEQLAEKAEELQQILEGLIRDLRGEL